MENFHLNLMSRNPGRFRSPDLGFFETHEFLGMPYLRGLSKECQGKSVIVNEGKGRGPDKDRPGSSGDPSWLVQIITHLQQWLIVERRHGRNLRLLPGPLIKKLTSDPIPGRAPIGNPSFGILNFGIQGVDRVLPDGFDALSFHFSGSTPRLMSG